MLDCITDYIELRLHRKNIHVVVFYCCCLSLFIMSECFMYQALRFKVRLFMRTVSFDIRRSTW